MRDVIKNSHIIIHVLRNKNKACVHTSRLATKKKHSQNNFILSFEFSKGIREKFVTASLVTVVHARCPIVHQLHAHNIMKLEQLSEYYVSKTFLKNNTFEQSWVHYIQLITWNITYSCRKTFELDQFI